MSKIVVLAGSPRKNGNTDRLVEAFVRGAKEAGTAAANTERPNTERPNTAAATTIDVISIADYHVNPCIGCNSCFTRERNQCFQSDDMTKIYAKLEEADTLIIASPVYFYGISAQLKAVIDRLHTPMRDRFHIRKLGLILVGAAQLPELFDAVIAQYRLVLNFFKLEDAGMVLVRGAREKGDVREEYLEKAYKLGQEISSSSCT